MHTANVSAVKKNPSKFMSDANPSIPMNGNATTNKTSIKMENAGIINPGTIQRGLFYLAKETNQFLKKLDFLYA